MERDHFLIQPAGPHIPPPSPLLLIISQHSSSPLPALHTPDHAHDLAHNVCPLPWTISSPHHHLWCTPNYPSKSCAKVASSGTSSLTPPLLCPPSLHLTHSHPCSPWSFFAPHPHDEQYESLFICLLLGSKAEQGACESPKTCLLNTQLSGAGISVQTQKLYQTSERPRLPPSGGPAPSPGPATARPAANDGHSLGNKNNRGTARRLS